MRYLNAVWDERQAWGQLPVEGRRMTYFRTGFTAPSRHAGEK